MYKLSFCINLIAKDAFLHYHDLGPKLPSLDQFKEYEKIGLDLGFKHVESSALVRSSYKAQKHIN